MRRLSTSQDGVRVKETMYLYNMWHMCSINISPLPQLRIFFHYF